MFSFDPEISYGQLHWSNTFGQLSNNTTLWVGGFAAHWDPVPQLDFEFELLYESLHQSTPGFWNVPPVGGVVNGVFRGGPFPFNNSDGFASRFEVTRSF